jgi:hypothetical protein
VRNPDKTLRLGLAALVTAIVTAPAAGARVRPEPFTPPGPNLAPFVARQQAEAAVRYVVRRTKHHKRTGRR